MKKIILLLGFFSLFTFNAPAQEIISSEIESEMEIVKLEGDEEVEVYYQDELKITSKAGIGNDKDYWIIRLEYGPKNDKVIDIYKLKLDEGCKPDKELSNLKISGHSFKLVFVKEE